MSETLPGTVWLTQAKYDDLARELEELRNTGRADVVKKVSEARDEGDLKENGAYHAAREELGKLDGRIAFLAETLELGGDARRGAVREGEVDEVVAAEGVEARLGEARLAVAREVRVDVADALPRVRVGRDGSDGDGRVAGEQAQGLSPGVAAGSGDGDGVGHGPILAQICVGPNIYAALRVPGAGRVARPAPRVGP